ncbi:MAG: sugar transferase [Silicimonas sp.]|nr:sugar transferase [Silicimonas sp.]
MTVHTSRIEVATDAAVSGRVVERRGPYRLGLKRLFDIALVILSLPFVLPFLALISIAVMLSDGGSPLFRQERVGKDGRRFQIWKFRSMVVDAEAQLARYLELNPEAKKEWETKQKLSYDPRCTTVGRLLRRSSIDELPQIFNVLVGDMSLVGPRPMMPCQQALYPGQAYYNMRPGMTGAWQVTSRNTSDFSDRAAYDDQYYARVSLVEDLRILAHTVGVVLRGTGV